MSRRNRAQTRRGRIDKALSPSVLQFTGNQPRGLQPRQFGLMDAINTATARLAVSGMAGVFEPLPRDPLDTTTFGPLNPLAPNPIDPVRRDTHRVEPRIFEYQNGWNLPGAGGRETPWQVLRAAADGVSIIRNCIEVRKRHMRALRWELAPAREAVQEAYRANPKRSQDGIEAEMRERLLPEINRLREFWKKPWHGNDWRMGQWINAILEEILVLDALPIYPRMNFGGDVLDLEVIDGSTIKPLLDWRGARPMPPYAAFQQILYGFPRGEWTASSTRNEAGEEIVENGFAAGELFYYRENVRAFTPYGYSPVERALMDSRIWLKRFGWLLAEYDDGSTPLTFLETAPASDGQAMGVQQRRNYEDAINDELVGQTRGRHRMKVLPHNWKPHQMTTAPERYRPEYDLFVIKLISSVFGVTIAEHGFTEPGGLGSTGWHEGQAEVTGRVGTRPDVEILSDVVNGVSREFLRMPAELEFRFIDPASQNDAESDGVADAQVKSARITLNDDRRRLGLALYDFVEADMPMIVTATGPVFLEGSFQRAQEAAEAAKQQQLAGAESARGKLELEGAKLEDGQKAREEGREFERERMDRAEASEAQKAAELGAFRTWRRRNPEPKRPFLFKAITPDDGFPELDGLTPDIADFGPDWDFFIDDLEKGVMTWLEWNTLHPTKPRGPDGRWVKRGSSLPDALRRESERTARLPDIGPSSSMGGMDIDEPTPPGSMDKRPEPFERGQRLMHRNRGEVIYEGADDEGMSWVEFADGTGGHVSTHLLAPMPTPPKPKRKTSAEKMDTDDQVREAYAQLKQRPGDWVSLADLRDQLGGTRDEQDAALRDLADRRQIAIIPEENQKTLTERDRAAALQYGGEPNHLLRIDGPPESPKRKTSAETRQAIESETARIAASNSRDARETIERLRAAPHRFAAQLLLEELPREQVSAIQNVLGVEYRGRSKFDKVKSILDVVHPREKLDVHPLTGLMGQLERALEMPDESKPRRKTSAEKDAEHRAVKARQERARAAADLAMDVDELVGMGASEAAIRSRLEGTRFDGLQGEALRDAVWADAEIAGMERIGGRGDEVVFGDPAMHRLLDGSRPEAGQTLRVLRPGARLKTGELYALARTMSEETPEQVRFREMDAKFREANAEDQVLASVKQAKQVVDLAQESGFLARVGHAKDSGDSPYMVIDLAHPGTGDQYSLTWHTRGTGAYRLFSKSGNEPDIGKPGYHDVPSVKYIMDRLRTANERTPAAQQRAAAREAFAKRQSEEYFRLAQERERRRVVEELEAIRHPFGAHPRPHNDMVPSARDGEEVIIRAQGKEVYGTVVGAVANIRGVATNFLVVRHEDGTYQTYDSRIVKREGTLKAAEPDFAGGAPDLEGNADPKADAPIPPDQRWPGWAVDAAIAAAVAPLLSAAVLSAMGGVGALTALLAGWLGSLALRPGDPLPDVRSWLVAGTDLKDQLYEELIPPIRQAHVEGWLVGQRSADAVMDWVREHRQSPRNAVEISVDWGNWEPGHPEAARLLIEPGGLAKLLAQSNVMIKTIAEHRLDEIGRIIGLGLQRGDAPATIARDLQQVGSAHWAKMTAITETNRAMSAASVESYRRGGCWGKGWMTAHDQRVCPICKENEEMPDGSARVVPIDGLFPSGDPWPPAHPHDRCAPIPVFELTRGF